MDNIDQGWILLGFPAIHLAVGFFALYLCRRADQREGERQ
jgi:hypothetical protein